ncbi:MAG: hypothetical protein C0198_05005 [Sulfurihydrogenibium sp.]|nr:MAG: hypothetical protein C0198_05005 [Sulfurihydrogenibium sp.]
MKYEVYFEKEALFDLEKLDRSIQAKIIDKIEKLGESFPNFPNIAQLKHYSNVKKLVKKYGKELYRLKIGDYRVIFFIDEDTRTINIVKIGHRKEVYDD